jgi:hypothetical protein
VGYGDAGLCRRQPRARVEGSRPSPTAGKSRSADSMCSAASLGSIPHRAGIKSSSHRRHGAEPVTLVQRSEPRAACHRREWLPCTAAGRTAPLGDSCIIALAAASLGRCHGSSTPWGATAAAYLPISPFLDFHSSSGPIVCCQTSLSQNFPSGGSSIGNQPHAVHCSLYLNLSPKAVHE